MALEILRIIDDELKSYTVEECHSKWERAKKSKFSVAPYMHPENVVVKFNFL